MILIILDLIAILTLIVVGKIFMFSLKLFISLFGAILTIGFIVALLTGLIATFIPIAIISCLSILIYKMLI